MIICTVFHLYIGTLFHFSLKSLHHLQRCLVQKPKALQRPAFGVHHPGAAQRLEMGSYTYTNTFRIDTCAYAS